MSRLAQPISEDDVEAVLDCLRSGWLTMGPRIAAFEEAFAGWVGRPHAATVSSGTSAVLLACRAAGADEEAEVLLPRLAAASTIAGVAGSGAAAVGCDVLGADNPVLDPDDVQRRLNEHTVAVIAVHPAGYSAPMDALREVCDAGSVALIEDCSEAIGARLDDGGRHAGTAGDLACFDLTGDRQLGIGEGGIVVTADEELDKRVRSLRSHAMTSVTWDRHRGHADSYDVIDIGFNFRMDEPRAALALSRLPRLEGDLAARRDAAVALRGELEGHVAFGRDAALRAAHAALPLLFADEDARDRCLLQLAERGVEASRWPVWSPDPVAGRLVSVPLPPHEDRAFAEAVLEAVAAAR
jgi:dTDP-4-amino-4,6-dideoxygalactose transaminase